MSLFGSKADGWPDDVPRLYPNLNENQLCEFMTDAQQDRIAEFPRIAVLMFDSGRGDRTEEEVAWGLARLLNRDLMLLSTHSIIGPEDTPDIAPWYKKDILKYLKLDRADACFVGRVERTDVGLALRLRLRDQEGTVTEREHESDDVDQFVRQATENAFEMLGAAPRSSIAPALESGRPRSFNSLRSLGKILRLHSRLDLGAEEQDDRHAELRKLIKAALKQDPGFILPAMYYLTPEGKEHLRRNLLLEVYGQDRYDPQLCFELFISLWDGRETQPEAVQFLRRAIELSPGHGKAHMCLPHAAPAQEQLLRHSELGYRLLRGNTFAINNYVSNLQRYGRPASEIVPIAEEGIQQDPKDPFGYERLIELLRDEGEYEEALEIAKRLYKLLTPPLNSRTRYCLTQNPHRANELRAGADLRSDVAKTIRWLEKRI